MTTTNLRAASRRLIKLHKRFSPLFGRAEPRKHSYVYINGLLLHQGRKSAEPMALNFANQPGRPKSQADALALQGFLTDSPWSHAAVQQEIQAVFSESLLPSAKRCPAGVVGVIDESSFVKSGPHSVGVARQHCGRLGKVENCQVGVFLLGVTPAGSALLDHQLYLPREWVEVVEPEDRKLSDEETRELKDKLQKRREKARIPTHIGFATKPQLALEMIERCTVPLDWVTMDDLYGRSHVLLTALEQRGQRYVAETPGYIRIWTEDPAVCHGPGAGERRASRHVEAKFARRLDKLAESLPKEAWKNIKVREGTKGPLTFQFARVRVWAMRARKAGPPIWAIIQRSLGPKPETRYWVSNAEQDVPLEEPAEVLSCRWRVEEAFEDAKGHLGMADYEARAWTSWHHHMSLVALAHLYVTLTRLEMRAMEPKLTLDMAINLLKASLPRPKLTEEDALHLIEYHLWRNETAHRSHKKTWLQKHPEAPG